MLLAPALPRRDLDDLAVDFDAVGLDSGFGDSPLEQVSAPRLFRSIPTEVYKPSASPQ